MEWTRKPFDQLSPMELFRILQGRCAVFVVEQECAYLDPDEVDPIAEHVFALQDGELVGCCRIVPPGVRYTEPSIGRVITMPQYRRQGLAREMLQIAIDHMTKTLRYRAIRISAQSYLQKFYGSLGFTVCSEEYLEDGLPHIEMLWSEGDGGIQG